MRRIREHVNVLHSIRNQSVMHPKYYIHLYTYQITKQKKHRHNTNINHSRTQQNATSVHRQTRKVCSVRVYNYHNHAVAGLNGICWCWCGRIVVGSFQIVECNYILAFIHICERRWPAKRDTRRVRLTRFVLRGGFSVVDSRVLFVANGALCLCLRVS